MGAYDILVHCKDCGKDHPIVLRIDVRDGTDHKQTVSELFQGRPIPPQVQAILGHAGFCHKTGRKFTLENRDDIILVSPKIFRRHSTIGSAN